MPTFHVTLEAKVPEDAFAKADATSEMRARSQVLAHCWYERRQIDWQFSVLPIKSDDQSPTRHQVRLSLDSPPMPRPNTSSLRFDLDIATLANEDARDKARRVLDLPGAPRHYRRRSLDPGSLDRGSFAKVRGPSVIGPVPDFWPVDRLLTDYSHNLGSYGQGGVGLSGWQLNGGSWLVLPLKYSDSFIWLTREELLPAPDYFSLDAIVDQRIIGVHPKQVADFPPWDHCYAGHSQILDLPDFSTLRPAIGRFEATESGFVLEAVNGMDRWRFAVGNHLPRPPWTGSQEPRVLYDGESIAAAFLLTHDCYLEV